MHFIAKKIMKNQPRDLPYQGLPSPRSFSQELSGPWRLKPPRSGKSRQPGISWRTHGHQEEWNTMLTKLAKTIQDYDL